MPNLNDTLLVKFKAVSESRKNGFGNRNKYTRTSDPIDDELAKINVRRFKTAPGQAIAEAVRHNLSLDSDVEFVEADGEGYGTPFTPNDPSYSSQWHLTKVNADDAWDDTQGDPAVIVAVLDTGADYSHPDLQGQLIRGPSYVTGVTASDDDHGHGTATAGTIVALINNGLGVSGVAPKCRVRVSKILDSTNWGSYSWWAAAMTNAADTAGVRVISMSCGGTSSSSTLQSAATYAWNKGIPVIAAAGNTGSTTLNYPAACTNVVSVSSTSQGDALSGFSSRGATIDIAAPGESILTTHIGGGYASWSGTSFSCPIVAGGAGLVRSIAPTLTATEVVAILKDNAYNTAPYDVTDSFGAGLLDIDAAVIAAAAATPVTPPPTPIAPGITITSPAAGATVSGTVNVAVSLTGEQLTTLELKVDGVSKLAGLPVTGPSMVIPWVSSGVADGSRVLSVILSQTGGATATATRTVTVLNATDAIAPTCSITAPTEGATIGKKGILKVIVSASDNRDTPVIRTYINGGLVKTVTATSSTYSWKYFNTPAGNVAITATATDQTGNVSSTATVNVTKTA